MSGGFDKGFSISPLAGGGGGGGGVPLNFSQTKGAQVTVTAVEAKPATVVSTTITTQGNPVQIIVAGDANPSAAGSWGLLNIYRDGTAVGQLVQFESSAANENVPYCLQVVDEPAAGTWTYSLKVTSVTADTQFGEAAGPIITVTELGAEAGGGGGTIVGTIAANEIAFGTGVDSIGGSAQLEWNAGTGVLTVSDAAVTPVLTVDTANAAVDLSVDELRLAGSPGAAGEVLTSNGPGVAPTWQAGGGGGGSIGGTIAVNEVAFGTGLDTISGSSNLTYNSGTQDLTVGDGTPHSIRIGPYGYVSNPIIESLESMNINIVNFGGALGIQAANNDLVLIGGDDGGGQSYLQTQDNVRLESKGRLLVQPATDGSDAVEIKDSAGTYIVQVDSTTKTVTLTGDANPVLSLVDEISATPFLQVTPSTREVAITDPSIPTNTTVISTTDVAVSDGVGTGNVSALSIGVTDTTSTNKITLSSPGGEATLKADDSAGVLVELHLSASTITVQSMVASGDFLAIDATTQRLTVVDPGTGVDSAYLEGGRITVDAAGNTISLDALTSPTITAFNVGSSLPMPLNLAIEALQINGASGSAGEVLTSQGAGSAPIWSAIPTLSITSEVFVTKGGSDVTGDGSLSKPYATVSAALASITTATPSARWAIRVAPGEYTEAGPIALKANVFIIGSGRRSTRLTSTGGWTLGASFTPAGDHRSGMTDVSLSGACTFNFSTVSSNEGKLYFDTCIFVSSVTITGFSSINQGEILDSNFFGSLTLSGVNWNNTGCVHFGQIFMNQHPTRATLLAATNGYADKITLTTTVNDFARRCSLFSRSFWTDDLEVDGDVSYADLSVDSVPRYGPVTLNNGNLINISPILLGTDIAGSLNPDTNNSRYFGDFGKQWLFNFNYLNVSTGTDLYVGTVDSSYDPAGSAAGYGVFLQPDQYGIRTDVNGGVLDMRTANATGTGTSGNVDVATGTSVNGNSGTVSVTTGIPTGTGTRGDITLTARQIDASSTPLLHKWESGATGSRPAPLAAGDVGRTFFDTTLGLPIWWNGTGWINAAGTPV